jgi:lysozyme family protein
VIQAPNSFLRAIAFTLRPDIEGGLSLDPEDRGNWTGGEVGKGELHGTRWGVSAAAYPHIDIQSLSYDGAKEIYLRDYWAPAGCNQLPQRLSIAVFDAAVNHGVRNAVTMLQEAAGATKDGVFGVNTLAAVNQLPQDEIIVDLIRIRLDFYRALKTFPRYGKGWQRRMIKLAMECSR